MLQWFIRFPEFAEFIEFNESSDPFRENSIRSVKFEYRVWKFLKQNIKMHCKLKAYLEKQLALGG